MCLPLRAGLFCFNRFRLNNLVGVSSLPCFECFWLGDCSWALKWLLTCLSRPPWVVNRAPQPATIQRNGLSPLWKSICRSSQDFEQDGVLYTLQPFHKHTTFSFSFWDCTWHARICSIISPLFTIVSQSFHWHSIGPEDSLDGVLSPFPVRLPRGLQPGLGTEAPKETGVHDLELSGVTGTIPFVPVTRGNKSATSFDCSTLKW